MEEMILRDYLWKRKGSLSQQEFAERVGITANYLSRLMNGGHIPSLQVAKKVEEVTHGEIAWDELILACEALVAAKKARKSTNSLT